VVTFSGDKLLSGPQAGILADAPGSSRAAPRTPVARAVRPRQDHPRRARSDSARVEDRGVADVPGLPAAAAATAAELERRGAAILARADANGGTVRGEVIVSQAAFGGGTSPEKLFESRAIALTVAGSSVDQIAARLRRPPTPSVATGNGAPPSVATGNGAPPIIARVERGRVLLDLRSILPEEDAHVAASLEALGRVP
jgi:L-seryl-tRNA(Ser) seleniumtransferase